MIVSHVVLLMEYRLKDDLICNALEPIDILFVGLNLIRGCTPKRNTKNLLQTNAVDCRNF